MHHQEKTKHHDQYDTEIIVHILTSRKIKRDRFITLMKDINLTSGLSICNKSNKYENMFCTLYNSVETMFLVNK